MQNRPGRKMCVPVPVIGLSASVESTDGWRAAGMACLLGKPFSRKDLRRVLQMIDARKTPEAIIAARAHNDIAKVEISSLVS